MPVHTAAVLGSPVGHSLSPVLHRAAYRALGLTGWSYAAVECDEDGLAGVLAAAGPEVVGYSCTMPLKRRLLQLASSVSPEAAGIGAGNTLLPRPAGWYAENTDWIGIRDALAAHGVPVTGAVTVLGAGGTAQAALAALTGASRVTVLVREPARAADLLATADRLSRPVTIGRLSEARPWIEADLILSTLPAGAADEFAELPFRREQSLLDVRYSPWPTPLAAALAERGARVVGGASMLLYQAARQVELMTGNAAPVEAMRAALLAAAPGCAA